mgnify:FL=1
MRHRLGGRFSTLQYHVPVSTVAKIATLGVLCCLLCHVILEGGELPYLFFVAKLAVAEPGKG